MRSLGLLSTCSSRPRAVLSFGSLWALRPEPNRPCFGTLSNSVTSTTGRTRNRSSARCGGVPEERRPGGPRLRRTRNHPRHQSAQEPGIDIRSAPARSTDPLMKSDHELRIFCLAIKGEIDGEMESAPMREDWQEVARLATESSDPRWAYRAAAQLGLVAFYEGDLETARRNVGGALVAATQASMSLRCDTLRNRERTEHLPNEC